MANWIGTTAQWLWMGRSKGYGPKFIKVSARQVKYRRGHVRAWLKERVFASTKDYPRKINLTHVDHFHGGFRDREPRSHLQ